jgi:V8-like Glu-specific endopeptidase
MKTIFFTNRKCLSGVFRIVARTSALFLFFFLCPNLGYSEETQASSQVYQQWKDSVFLVNQSVYLDSGKITEKELFLKLEEAMDQKILDQYIPIASGTAFLINGDGNLITAFHVIKYMSGGEKSDYALWSFLEFIGKHMIPGNLSRRDMQSISWAYKKAIREAPIVISVKSASKVSYLAKVIAQDDNLDLALLKIDLKEKTTPILVNEDATFKEGDSVLTIGYPLTFIMDSFLDDFKPTLTNGIISAIRTDKWSIQHTASMNGGNSGGPLLSKDGKLIGVNVGLITKANNIYFSTNASKIIEWLKRINKLDVLKIK